MHTKKRWEETHDLGIIWEGHRAGMVRAYCQIEKLHNLEDLPALRFSPEMCSMNMGSMNFSFHPLAKRYDTWKFDWERDYVANSDHNIFRNTFADIESAANQLAPYGINFEHECYDVGHLYNLRFCMDIGLFKAPIFIQFIFGILGGISPEVDNLIFMKRTADRLFGDDYRWSVLGAGGAQMSLAITASQDGRECARGPGR